MWAVPFRYRREAGVGYVKGMQATEDENVRQLSKRGGGGGKGKTMTCLLEATMILVLVKIRYMAKVF